MMRDYIRHTVTRGDPLPDGSYVARVLSECEPINPDETYDIPLVPDGTYQRLCRLVYLWEIQEVLYVLTGGL